MNGEDLLLTYFNSDINFWRDESGRCELFSVDPKQPNPCKGTYKGSSGYRKVGLSQCKGGVHHEELVDRKCNDFDRTPGSGEIFQSAR